MCYFTIKIIQYRHLRHATFSLLLETSYITLHYFKLRYVKSINCKRIKIMKSANQEGFDSNFSLFIFAHFQQSLILISLRSPSTACNYLTFISFFFLIFLPSIPNLPSSFPSCSLCVPANSLYKLLLYQLWMALHVVPLAEYLSFFSRGLKGGHYVLFSGFFFQKILGQLSF